MNRPRSLSSSNSTGLLVFLLTLAAFAGRVMADEPDDTKVTLRESEKVKKQEFPWGWIRWQINAEVDPQAEMTLGVVYIKPHQENPLHLHPNSAEYLHVIAGSCEHLVGKTWVKLKVGDTLRIPLGVPHRARTIDQPCQAVIVYNTGTRQMVEVKEDKSN
jgi:quercetin dioxygenase-like cupin family protein